MGVCKKGKFWTRVTSRRGFSPRSQLDHPNLNAEGTRTMPGAQRTEMLVRGRIRKADASFQVLGISCVAYPALAQLHTCLAPRAGASSCFDATRGFPGEGPKTNSPETNDGNFTSESAAAGTNADQLRIANDVGCKVFGELWGEMACRITGTDVKKMRTLLFKCRCTPSQPAAAGSAVKEERTFEDLKVLKHNQRMGSVESWAHACGLLKEYIHRSHCGEKCTPTLIANKNPPTKRQHEGTWLT